MDNNGGLYYQVTTGPSLLTVPGPLIFGTVYQSNGSTIVPNAIVYLQLQDANSTGSTGLSQLVSARADASGVYFFNLANVRESNFQNWFSFTPGVDNLRIIGQGGIQGTVGLDPTPWIITTPVTFLQQNIILNQAPTAVTLASFSQGSLTNGVQLDWSTATEVGLLGFNLYRSDELEGVKQKLNADLIPALTPGDLLGNSYQFADGTAISGKTYTYWIELVMLDGNQLSDPLTLLVPYWLRLPMIPV